MQEIKIKLHWILLVIIISRNNTIMQVVKAHMKEQQFWCMDISGLPWLQELRFSGCSKGHLTGENILLHATNRCRNITHLDGSWTNLSSQGIIAFSEESERCVWSVQVCKVFKDDWPFYANYQHKLVGGSSAMALSGDKLLQVISKCSSWRRPNTNTTVSFSYYYSYFNDLYILFTMIQVTVSSLYT